MNHNDKSLQCIYGAGKKSKNKTEKTNLLKFHRLIGSEKPDCNFNVAVRWPKEREC